MGISAHPSAGMLEHITSYASATGGTVVNDVLRVYNGFQQLVTEYQEHNGAVNTGTSANVQYAYADGSGNTIRLTDIIYPNGRKVSLVYDSPADDMLSRPTAIVDGTLTSGLISYWPLNEEVSSGTRFDWADGNNLADVDSNVNNAAGLSSGNLGVAAQFTTSPNSQLALNPAPDLGFNDQSFTTTGWIRFDSVSGYSGVWGQGDSAEFSVTDQEWVLFGSSVQCSFTSPTAPTPEERSSEGWPWTHGISSPPGTMPWPAR